jgi:hypothetical protein
MSRWIWIWVCTILAVTLLVFGLLIPVHLRAADSKLLKRAGLNTSGLVERGLTLAREQQLGSAQLIFRAAQIKGFPDQEKLGRAVDELAAREPRLLIWGRPEPELESIGEAKPSASGSNSFSAFIIRAEPRGKALELLRGSPQPAVRELLHCRTLNRLAVFSPSQSASGQAFDAAIAICGLLIHRGHVSTNLSNAIYSAASLANSSGNSQSLEGILLDTMSLGQRLNWGQLVKLVTKVETPETLRAIANLSRRGNTLPVLFAAVELSGEPDRAARYLVDFSETGLADLGNALYFGAGGVKELLLHNQRLHSSPIRERAERFAPLAAFSNAAADWTRRNASAALGGKWFLFLAGGFFLAMAVHFARPAVSPLERPLQVRGFHIARELLFALGFLALVLLLSEPFLSQENQKMEFPFRLQLPTVGGAAPASTTTSAHPTIMNTTTFLTMLLFFVLQALLYVASLLKLAEIRRQRVSARMKIKLLENEDHLFDAGLYLGFLGTIISLVLVSLGLFKQPSLMAAYSSTSFGILFVVFFKVVHLRPARRHLLLEAESEMSVHVEQPVENTLAAPL